MPLDMGNDPQTGKPYVTFDLEFPKNPKPDTRIQAECECCGVTRACIPVVASNGKRYVWCGACSAGLAHTLKQIPVRIVSELFGLRFR